MKTLITYILLLFGIAQHISCQNNTNEVQNQLEKDDKPIELQQKHVLFNGEVELLLEKKYKPYSFAELNMLSKKMKSNSLIQALFNEEQVQLAENLGSSYCVFIDTTSFLNIIQLENLNEFIAINKEAASVIGGLLKKKLQVLDPIAEVQIESAKFGAQPTFTYGYYKMKSTSNQLTSFSNHYAISSSKSTYLLNNISTQDYDFSNFKNQISFH